MKHIKIINHIQYEKLLICYPTPITINLTAEYP